MSNEPTQDHAPDQAGGQSPATPAMPAMPATPAAADEDDGAADAVLEASLESFPGSDAPAWTGSRGTP